MSNLIVRRMQMATHANRRDIIWAMFEVGELRKPLRILTDFEMDDIIDQVNAQRLASKED